jgi:hypothetical protein
MTVDEALTRQKVKDLMGGPVGPTRIAGSRAAGPTQDRGAHRPR